MEILANPTSYPGDTISFKSCSMDGSSYLWEFGDGYTSTEANPYHVYHLPKDYSVKLTVTSDNGKKSSSDVKSIKINFLTKIIINEIILTKFPEEFIDPNILMIFSLDSNIINTNSQIYENAKQGMRYTFDIGFPYTFIGENGDFGTAQFEFKDCSLPSDSTIIGFQSVDLYTLAHVNMVGGVKDVVRVGSSSGIEFEIHFKTEN
jgi:hypothetical protein